MSKNDIYFSSSFFKNYFSAILFIVFIWNYLDIKYEISYAIDKFWIKTR